LLILVKTLPIIGPNKVSTPITTTATSTSISAYSTTIFVNLQVVFLAVQTIPLSLWDIPFLVVTPSLSGLVRSLHFSL
jgi:hypothetical protein